MKIYGFPGCPYVNRVQIGLAVRGLSARFPLEVVDLEKPPPSLLRINPLGTVPTLEVATGDGFNESLAILLYLDSVDVPGPRLFGSPQATGKVQALIELVQTRFLSTVQNLLYSRGKVPRRKKAAEKFPAAITAMNSLLEEHAPHGLFGGAANPNAVDCAVAPFLAELALLITMVPEIPAIPSDSRLARYVERLLSHDVVRGALPEPAILKQALAVYAFPAPEIKEIQEAPREILDENACAVACRQLGEKIAVKNVVGVVWKVSKIEQGAGLTTTFRFPSTHDAIAALEDLNDIQETADHHASSSLIDFKTLTLTISTHEPKPGLSQKDFALAYAISCQPSFQGEMT